MNWAENIPGNWGNYARVSRVRIPCGIHGGEGGIRTPDTIAGINDFESFAFDRSATSPWSKYSTGRTRYQVF